MRKFLPLVLCLALLVSPLSNFASQEVNKTRMSKEHQRAYDAALALYGTSGDTTHFICSSTVVSKVDDGYLLLTAGHCITGDGLPDDIVFGVREDIAEDSPKPTLQPVSVVRAQNDSKYDFAVLHLVTAKTYPVIEIDASVPEIEDKVYDVNFSLGLGKQVALGVVATGVLDTQSSHGDCYRCKGRYMVHIFAAGGASGSAIISEKTHKIVGVGEFGFPGTTTGLGCETTVALKAWLESPAPSKDTSPKA